MKKILLLLLSMIVICIPSVCSANSNQKNVQIQQALNNYAQNNDNASFDSATVKRKTITVKVADDFIEAPVKDSGRVAFLEDLYQQINKIQKKYHTKYNIVVRDEWTGKFAKMNYKGKGWYTAYGHEEKNPKNKCNFSK